MISDILKLKISDNIDKIECLQIKLKHLNSVLSRNKNYKLYFEKYKAEKKIKTLKNHNKAFYIALKIALRKETKTKW